MMAAGAVIGSPPDGYTILLLGTNHAIGATLYKNLSYVVQRDITPVAGLMQTTNVMVVPPSVPVKTVAEFIAYAKANPGKLSYASSGSGTTVHLSAELFKTLTGVSLVHVPYRGMALAYPDLFAGQVHVAFDNLPGVIEFVRTGKLRALAVTAATRSAALPDVPTIGETVKGFETNVWYGIAGPKGMPPEAVEILNRSINAAFADPRIKARVAELGAAPMPMSPPQFGKLIADETEKWAEVVKFSGATPE
jgi:tripartite-type tricarboxylate transporter receptor subunit TctC